MAKCQRFENELLLEIELSNFEELLFMIGNHCSQNFKVLANPKIYFLGAEILPFFTRHKEGSLE